VNFAEAESCNQAVENMNNYVVGDKYILRVVMNIFLIKKKRNHLYDLVTIGN
jgi:hypothetical protein